MREKARNVSELDFDNHPLDYADRLVNYLESVPKDPTLRRDFFRRMSPDDFILNIQRLREITETGDALEHPFDGSGVMTMILLPPEHDDKPELLRASWGAVVDILGNNLYSDQQALDYAATVAGVSLVSAHPFKDGNGRTSRILSYTIATGCVDAQEMMKIISKGVSNFWETGPLSDAGPYPPGTGSGWSCSPSAILIEKIANYITPEEYKAAFHKGTSEDGIVIDEASSLKQAQFWNECSRKLRVARFLSFLDLAKENPRLPLSKDFSRSIVQDIAYHDKKIDELSEELRKPDLDWMRGASLKMDLEFSIKNSRYLHAKNQIMESILGGDYLNPSKTFPLLDQLVAYQRSHSEYFWTLISMNDRLSMCISMLSSQSYFY